MLQIFALKNADEKQTLDAGKPLENTGKIENQPAKNAQYFSNRTQNEIIECIGDVVLENILDDLKKVGVYSIIADEATDVASVHQMSIVLRFVDVNNDFEVREAFAGFIELSAGTGQSLANYILRFLEQCDISSAVMVGQGYDGAAAMSGCNIGCQVYVREVHKAAIYVHCSAHNLNLAVAKSSTVPEVILATNLISEVHDFFKNHHYVSKYLSNAIRGILDSERKRSVRGVCNTRWVDSHTACVDFCTLFECIATALSDCYLQCEQVAAQAKSLELLKKVADPDFIFTVVLLARCNAVLRCLSKELQKEDTDLTLASA